MKLIFETIDNQTYIEISITQKEYEILNTKYLTQDYLTDEVEGIVNVSVCKIPKHKESNGHKS